MARFVPFDFAACLLWAVYCTLLGYLGGRTFEDRPILALLLAFGLATGIGAISELIRRKRRMNRLADETSPYLLQHADNPVDWYPWGDEALERARRPRTSRSCSRSATRRATGAT